MQRRLVGYRSTEDRRAAALEADGHSVEPWGPSRIEVTREANFATAGRLNIPGNVRVSAHLLLSLSSWRSWKARSRCGERASPRTVIRCGDSPAAEEATGDCGPATASRAHRLGGLPPGGCSRRASQRCSSCDFEPC